MKPQSAIRVAPSQTPSKCFPISIAGASFPLSPPHIVGSPAQYPIHCGFPLPRTSPLAANPQVESNSVKPRQTWANQPWKMKPQRTQRTQRMNPDSESGPSLCSLRSLRLNPQSEMPNRPTTPCGAPSATPQAFHLIPLNSTWFHLIPLPGPPVGVI